MQTSLPKSAFHLQATNTTAHSMGVSILHHHYLSSRSADNCWSYVPVKELHGMSSCS